MGVPEEWPSPARVRLGVGQNPAYRPSDPAFSNNRGREPPPTGIRPRASPRAGVAPLFSIIRSGGSPPGAIKILKSAGLLETNLYRSSDKKSIIHHGLIGWAPRCDSAGRIAKTQALAVCVLSITIGMGSKPLRFLADSILSRLRPGFSHVIPYRPDLLRLGRGAPAAGRRGRGPWRSGPKS